MKDSNFISMLNEAEKRHGSFSVKCLNFFEKKKNKITMNLFLCTKLSIGIRP